ncbi:DNA helicase related protein [Pyrococcus yayanosii CH1]|uniref:DNA helicase related protein n=2 Tax=Pyrococcus TaxID=2260 RepID=F8AIH7_PYRYC|nr:DNA helicase related protein [Pyrococcus yayanosii CH1]
MPEILHPSEIARFFELQECSNYLRLLFSYKRGELEKYKLVLKVKEEAGRSLAKWGENFEVELLRRLRHILLNTQFYGFFTSCKRDGSFSFFNRFFPKNIILCSSDQECFERVGELLKREDKLLLYQPHLRGRIGAFIVSGRADFIVREGSTFYILEAKFTREEKLAHRFQAVTYAYLLAQMLEELKIRGRILLAVITKGKLKGWPPESFEFSRDVEEYVMTLEGKLSENGPFARVLRGGRSHLWLTARCAECPFEPVCIKEAVEARSLGLLGIPPGHQEAFKSVGVNTVDDLAGLFEFSSLWPTNFSEPVMRRPDIVLKLMRVVGITNLPKLSRLAQVIKRELDRVPGDKAWPEFIPGTGYNLPKDTCEGKCPENYPAGSLVRVYLFIEQSHITDTLLGASAVVENTMTGKMEIVAEVVEEPPMDPEIGEKLEGLMLDKFFRKLFAAIRQVAPNLEGETYKVGRKVESCNGDEVFLHLYFYSRFHRDALMDAVRRHPHLYGSRAIRALLSLRRAIDQEGYSIIKDELISRHALRFPPGLGIMLVASQFGFKWRVVNGFEEIFKFLAERRGYEINLEKLYSIAEEGLDSKSKALYPVFNREDEQIPFTAFWQALLDEKKDSLLEMLKQMALAVRHIERRIPEKVKDAWVPKEPLSMRELESFDLESPNLASVLMEYQMLEFFARKQQLEQYYRLPRETRAYLEKSAFVQVEDVITSKSGCFIRGKIVLPDSETWRPYSKEEVLIDLDEGSWVAVTPLEAFGNEDPARVIRRSPLGVITRIDHDDGSVEVKLIGTPGRGRFIFSHEGFSCKKGKITIGKANVISKGSIIVLDPSIDDISMSRAYDVLEKIIRGKRHYVYEKLSAIYSAGKVETSDDNFKINIWQEEDIEEFLVKLENVAKLNEEQKKFVKDIHSFLVSLQGPPGTGKTARAVAPAILARAYSSIKRKKDALFIVTAISHRAVNEALIKTARLLEELSPLIPELKNVELIRGLANEEAIESIKRELEGIKNIKFEHEKLNFGGGQRSLEAIISKRGLVKVLFATPQTLAKIVEWGKADLVVVDEASMMDLPIFLLATAPARGQVLIVGDHRQMQPIQVHEWELEDRKTIEEHLPFLSAINFIRFLRGELEERELKKFKRILGRDPPEWIANKDDILPVYRLKKTYRLPEALAKLHTELFYIFDGIELESEKKYDEEKLKLLREASRERSWVGWILDPKHPVVLIVHEESSSTKINEFEAKLVAEIVSKIPNGLSIGIVVPYRAQKRLIKSLIGNKAEVDTVERFQGGERDVIIVSMTSSDPAYLMQVFDFIYNPNRLNVAASRAKEKLILIASENLFTLSAHDLDHFEKLRPWKKFYLLMTRKEELRTDKFRAFR